ncbi:hypothetical protein Droror1_Dr00016362 [Drosera rotundifolia]
MAGMCFPEGGVAPSSRKVAAHDVFGVMAAELGKEEGRRGSRRAVVHGVFGLPGATIFTHRCPLPFDAAHRRPLLPIATSHYPTAACNRALSSLSLTLSPRNRPSTTTTTPNAQPPTFPGHYHHQQTQPPPLSSS